MSVQKELEKFDEKKELDEKELDKKELDDKELDEKKELEERQKRLQMYVSLPPFASAIKALKLEPMRPPMKQKPVSTLNPVPK